MITVPSSLLGVKKQTHHRYAKLWKIVRIDDEEFHFTSHDKEIVYGGDTYTPVYGMSSSAYEEKGELDSANKQFDGVFDSSYIDQDEMVLGKFNRAAVTEYMVDWRYPWAGVFYTSPFWIVRLSYSDSQWSAEVASILDVLKDEVGEVFTSNCRHRFGDNTAGGCSLNIASYTYSGTPTGYDDTDQRKRFVKFTHAALGSPAGLEDGDLDHGFIEGSSSQNTGFKREIKSHSYDSDNSPYYHTIELYFPMPEDMNSLGGTYSVSEGCNLDIDECDTRWSNTANHGGWFLCPGNDLVTEMPDEY